MQSEVSYNRETYGPYFFALTDQGKAVLLPERYLCLYILSSTSRAMILSALEEQAKIFTDLASPISIDDIRTSQLDNQEEVYVSETSLTTEGIHTLLCSTQPILGPLVNLMDNLFLLPNPAVTIMTSHPLNVYQILIQSTISSIKLLSTISTYTTTVLSIRECVDNCDQIEELRFFYQHYTETAGLDKILVFLREYLHPDAINTLMNAYRGLVRGGIGILQSMEVDSYLRDVPIFGDEPWLLKLQLPDYLSEPLQFDFPKYLADHPNIFVVGSGLTIAASLPSRSVSVEDLKELRVMAEIVNGGQETIAEFFISRYQSTIHIHITTVSGLTAEVTAKSVPAELTLVSEGDELNRDWKDLVEVAGGDTNSDSFTIAFPTLVISLRSGSRYESIRACVPTERGYLGAEGLQCTATSYSPLQGGESSWILYPSSRLLQKTLQTHLNMSQVDSAKLIGADITGNELFFSIVEELETYIHEEDLINKLDNNGYVYQLVEGKIRESFYTFEGAPEWYKE